jgi:autotransporter-associated beta strand protein
MRKNHIADGQWLAVGTALLLALFSVSGPATAAQPRALGLDISAWQGNISQTTWNNIRNVENRQFVFLRASRGGTTGYDHLRGGYPADNNDAFTLSQRYDDPYFVQNINRATTAGMFAGSYHFGRMDVIASTPNAGGIPNNGTDEANHFIQQAGPWMRPGYLLPVFDFEAGSGIRTASELAQFSIDFSNRIYQVMGIRPAVYIGGNYATPMDNIALADEVVAAYPTLWTARWPNQADPDSIPVQTADPGDFTPTVYGPWDNPPNPADPWHFWQYASTGRLQSFNNGNSNLDFDVAKGGTEYLKDHLVPALWWSDSSGDWNELSNWNSGQTPIAPPGDPTVVHCGTCPVGTTGQLDPIGAQTLPTPRLPGAAGAGVTSGQNDTVILDRGAANPTITISSGSHNIRKLYVREALNITGGSLTVNYDNPKYATTDPSLHDPAAGLISAQFSAPVSLGGSASMSVYRLQVDPARTFTVGGGSLTFNQIDLMPHASTPASIAMTGNVNFLPLENATATIASSGAGSPGLLDLAGGVRTFNVSDGSSSIDMSVNVPITNGGLAKSGSGTLALSGANSYTGDTFVQAGQLQVGNPFLADAAAVHVQNGSTLHLGFSGNDVVRSLFLNGLPQAEGIWGAEGSGAQFTSPLLSGSGLLHVTATPPAPPSGPGNVLDDFEVDEGHFNHRYGFSPQTFGLASGPSGPPLHDDRTTTQHQGLGVASQLLDLTFTIEEPLIETWQLRHNSGIGTPAVPASNVPLEPTGYVGFWLKTDDPGITVRLAIDDPVPAGATAIEHGIPLSIIADNQWHLYQWNFEDDNHWDVFPNAGSDGEIDATNGTITIDSIWFNGSGNAQIYLDTVSHNPNGLLAAYIPGDYDRNGIVQAADKAIWQAAFGSTVIPGAGADGSGDGIVDTGDYLVWRKAMSQPAPPSPSTAPLRSATPEPGGLTMIIAAGVACLSRRRTRNSYAPASD